MKKFSKIIKDLFLRGFKYGKIIGIIWLISFIIMAPIVFIYGGWVALSAYILCKFSGVCPI